MRPAESSELSIKPPYEVDDDNFKKLVATIRIAVPYTGMILSTHELLPSVFRLPYPSHASRDAHDYHALVELLGQLLVLCEEVVHTVHVPLGCNNPSCTNLEGLSEASAVKVCTGCHKVHYCSHGCIKAHWKEHKP